MTIATREPERITAGDTAEWIISAHDYLPADGWTLTYALVSASQQITITGSDNGDGRHLVSVSTSTTADWSAGTYQWQSYVSDGADRHMLKTGTVEILPDFATASAGYDARSHVKKVLDALEATLLGKAAKDQLSISIAGRSLQRMTPAELIRWRNIYRDEYRSEQQAERIRQGLGHGGRILVRF